MDTKLIGFFEALGISSAGTILVLIVIGFFGKKLIEYFFSETVELKKAELSREIESFKATISSQAQIHKLQLDKNMESYKSSLQLMAHEQQTKFLKLHTDRAEVVKELFKRIVAVEKSMNSLMAPFQATGEPSLSEKSTIAAADANNFLDYYQSNELLFNEQTCSIITKLNDSIKSAWKSYHMYHHTYGDPDLEQKRIDATLKAYYDVLNKEVIAIKDELKKDLREILGVH